MAEMIRWKDVGCVLAEDLGSKNPNFTYTGTGITDGPYGRTRTFDGTNENIQTNTYQHFIQQTGIFTITFKAKRNVKDDTHRILYSLDATPLNGWRVQFASGTDSLNFYIANGGAGIANLTWTIDDSTKEHVYVFVGDGTHISLYVDGVLNEKIAITTPANFGGTQSIPTPIGSPSATLNGTIKEVIMDDRAWSAQECLDYSNTPATITTDGVDDYINTGVALNGYVSGDILEIEVDGVFSEQGYVFGTRQNSPFDRLELSANTTSSLFTLRPGIAGVAPSISIPLNTGFTKLKIRMDCATNLVTFSDEHNTTSITHTSNLTDWTSPYPISIAALNTNNSVSSFATKSINKFKVIKNGTELINFVPVKAGETINGVTATSNGLFDKVNNVAYGNDGTGDLEYSKGEGTFDYDKDIVSNWNLDAVDTVKDIAALQKPRTISDGADDYIDTGAVPVYSEDWYIEIRGNFTEFLTSPNAYNIMGVQSASDNERLFFGEYSGEWLLGYKTDYTASSTSADLNTHNFKVTGNGKLYVDNVLVSDKNNTEGDNATNPFALFRMLHSSPDYDCAFSVEYAKVMNDGTLVRDFIPIKKGQSMRGVTASGNGLFDRVNGTVYTNDGTGDLDYKKENDGTVVGTPTVVDTEVGKGLELDGIGDYVSSDLASSEEVTVCTILKTLDATNSKRVLQRSNTTDGDGYAFRIMQSSNKFEWVSENASLTSAVADNVFALGKTYSLVGVSDSTSNKLYIDNVLQSGTRNVTISGVTGDIFNIGGRFSASEGYFNGVISKVIVLNKTLTETQIKDVDNRIKRGEL